MREVLRSGGQRCWVKLVRGSSLRRWQGGVVVRRQSGLLGCHHMLHPLQESVDKNVGGQLADGSVHLRAAFWTQKLGPLGLNILQTFSAESVLAGEYFVRGIQLFQAD